MLGPARVPASRAGKTANRAIRATLAYLYQTYLVDVILITQLNSGRSMQPLTLLEAHLTLGVVVVATVALGIDAATGLYAIAEHRSASLILTERSGGPCGRFSNDI